MLSQSLAEAYEAKHSSTVLFSCFASWCALSTGFLFVAPKVCLHRMHWWAAPSFFTWASTSAALGFSAGFFFAPPIFPENPCTGTWKKTHIVGPGGHRGPAASVWHWNWLGAPAGGPAGRRTRAFDPTQSGERGPGRAGPGTTRVEGQSDSDWALAAPGAGASVQPIGWRTTIRSGGRGKPSLWTWWPSEPGLRRLWALRPRARAGLHHGAGHGLGSWRIRSRFKLRLIMIRLIMIRVTFPVFRPPWPHSHLIFPLHSRFLHHYIPAFRLGKRREPCLCHGHGNGCACVSAWVVVRFPVDPSDSFNLKFGKWVSESDSALWSRSDLTG